MKHVNIGAGDTFFEIGGDYFLNNGISLGVTLELASETNALTFGGRFYY